MNREEVEQSRPTWGMSWYMLDGISDKTGNVHLFNNCCSGKSVTITHTETVIVPFGIQKAVHVSYCHLRPAWLCNNFPHYLTKAQFLKKLIEHEMGVLILSTTFFWNISHCKKKRARCDQKCIMAFMLSTSYMPDFNETWIF